ncbi:hypothetical protein SEA_ATUIN_243 [Arthrobacter phage Atuin]|nr:hypothetical protein SEA_ATUIN_42 [Arthrobacter phage Atuin]
MNGYGPRPGSSRIYFADPVNGIVITPYLGENEDFCLNCAQPIRRAPLPPQESYWFHIHTLQKNCLEKELVSDLRYDNEEGD